MIWRVFSVRSVLAVTSGTEVNHLLLLSVIENCLGLVRLPLDSTHSNLDENCPVVMVTCHFPMTFPRCSSLTITVALFLFSQMSSFFIGFVVLSEDRMNAIMEFKMTYNVINASHKDVLWMRVRIIVNGLLRLATATSFSEKIKLIYQVSCVCSRWRYMIGASAPSDCCWGSPGHELATHPGACPALPTCSWDSFRHAARDPTTDRANKKKSKRKEREGFEKKKQRKETHQKHRGVEKDLKKKNYALKAFLYATPTSGIWILEKLKNSGLCGRVCEKTTF